MSRRGTAPKCPRCAQFYKGALAQHVCGKPGTRPGYRVPRDTVEKRAAANRGRKQTAQARANMCVAARTRAAKGGHPFQRQDVRARGAASRRGKPVLSFLRPDSVHKRTEAIAKTERSRASTSIELTVRVALAAMGVAFIRSYPVAPFIVDMFVPALDLAIECDGDYWHSRPEAAAHDARKTAALVAAGLTVLRLTETEIRNGSFYEKLCAAVGRTPNSIDGETPNEKAKRR